MPLDILYPLQKLTFQTTAYFAIRFLNKELSMPWGKGRRQPTAFDVLTKKCKKLQIASQKMIHFNVCSWLVEIKFKNGLKLWKKIILPTFPLRMQYTLTTKFKLPQNDPLFSFWEKKLQLSFFVSQKWAMHIFTKKNH